MLEVINDFLSGKVLIVLIVGLLLRLSLNTENMWKKWRSCTKRERIVK